MGNINKDSLPLLIHREATDIANILTVHDRLRFLLAVGKRDAMKY